MTKAFGVEINERTNVKTEPGRYATNVKNVFTAGDMHRGQSLVVWAIREGREVAREIDESLMGYTNPVSYTHLEVPIHPDILGKSAVDCMPCIMQAFIERPSRYAKGLEFDRRLYVVRRIFEQSSDDTYVVSLSSRTIVYKGIDVYKRQQ